MNDAAEIESVDSQNSGGEDAQAAGAGQVGNAVEEAAAQKSRLKRLLLKGSAAEVGGMAAQQLIRLASNLILSRVLYPQAFGIMAIVNIVNQGLYMFSDAGLHAAVIQSERGEDKKFLDTIFTWQAMRGVGLWIISCLVAVPAAYLYSEPSLKQLIPAGSLTVVILGFHSTAMYTLRRRLNLLPLVGLELLSQIVGVGTTIAVALQYPSPWALVVGVLASAAFTASVSHFLPVGYKNKFHWDKESAKAMFDFGKWVAGSSMLTFASLQGDRLMLGHFLGTATLGVYSIAVFLSGALGDVISRVSSGVLFPAYSQVRSDGGNDGLRDVYYKTRLPIDGLVMPALGGLCMLGKVVVDILYDDRYQAAGWMLQILTVRVACTAIVNPAQYVLFSLGQTRDVFFPNLARVLWLITMVPAGFHVFGVPGLVWGAALSELPPLLVVLFALARTGLMRPFRELFPPLLFGAGAVLGLGVLQGIHAFWPALGTR